MISSTPKRLQPTSRLTDGAHAVDRACLKMATSCAVLLRKYGDPIYTFAALRRMRHTDGTRSAYRAAITATIARVNPQRIDHLGIIVGAVQCILAAHADAGTTIGTAVRVDPDAPHSVGAMTDSPERKKIPSADLPRFSRIPPCATRGLSIVYQIKQRANHHTSGS
jgi:hypothetical protein